ncbi:hypothetical protein BWO91_17305 [Plantibacter flavus]|uniref:hypothetical protein n=1 Tax=Plantibacter flavus TaxID=150123 RepID=UPI00099CBB71|nr:hypothetical protein [Plantibacter flavus]AQX81484.1 hypothetical protein BWO91_17305 [Plantibacter flavus]
MPGTDLQAPDGEPKDESDLAEYVKSPTEDEAFVKVCWEDAVALVDHRIGTSTVPVTIRERAYLEVGSEFFHRRQAPNGVAQFAAFDGAPVRIARDPMVAANAILAPFLPLGIG